MAGFDGWLSKKLLQINPDVDLEVFVSYIRSIVESEENVEEATDALDGILGEIVVRQRCTSDFVLKSLVTIVLLLLVVLSH